MAISLLVWAELAVGVVFIIALYAIMIVPMFGARWTIYLTIAAVAVVLALTGCWQALATIGVTVVFAALIIVAWRAAPIDPPYMIDGENG